MNTRRLCATKAQDLSTAAKLLKSGKLVALPTETVYGLAADATQPDAVSAIFTAKGRPANHPLIVHIGDIRQLADWAIDVPPCAYELAKAFWPGPLTLLLKRAPHASPIVTGGLETIAIRMPADPTILSILRQANLALAAPSANPYKQLSPTTSEQVLEGLNGKIDAVVDGGECQFGLESTIVDLTSETVQILRAGPISSIDISEQLQCAVHYPQHHEISVPGNVSRHYQPKTPLRLIDHIAQSLSEAEPEKRYALVSHSAVQAGRQFHHYPLSQEASEYGKALYRTLALADKQNCDEIWLERPPKDEAWHAIHDRLNRAAYSESVTEK